MSIKSQSKGKADARIPVSEKRMNDWQRPSWMGNRRRTAERNLQDDIDLTKGTQTSEVVAT